LNESYNSGKQVPSDEDAVSSLDGKSETSSVADEKEI